LDDTDAAYVSSDTIDDTVGEFSFADPAQNGRASQVLIAICCKRDAAGKKIEVSMWESVGGWEVVGNVTPDGTLNKKTIDVSAKFPTWWQLDEAKMRLKLVAV